MFTGQSNPDKHPLDPLMKLFACRCFLILVFVTAMMAGVFLSILKQDWTWLNRFGAVVIVTGLLFTMSPLFSNGIYKSQSGAGRMGDLGADGSVTTTTPEERKIGNNVALGIIVTIIGTLTNAFGDLLGSSLYSF
ncbi:hypothetical protein ACSVIJ_01600 [Pseudomonas sp. NCHU5208]|uniref:hypothetical protein n=1 Tax=unclassified Pseudomonas TaxID=196821 RepID=UPI003F94F4CF